MYTRYQVNTWKCDIPECNQEISLSGVTTQYLASGWWQGKIMNENYDLCPEHYAEVLEFFGFAK